MRRAVTKNGQEFVDSRSTGLVIFFSDVRFSVSFEDLSIGVNTDKFADGAERRKRNGCSELPVGGNKIRGGKR